jgi:hypothetical protein
LSPASARRWMYDIQFLNSFLHFSLSWPGLSGGASSGLRWWKVIACRG